MKKVRLFLMCWISMVTVGFAASAAQPLQPLNAIAAIVNNEVITQSALDTEIAMMKQQLQANNQPLPADAQLHTQILNQMIDQKLVLQMAAKEKITVSDGQLDAAIEKVAGENHLTIAQMQQQIEKQGMNYQVYKQQVRQQLLMNAVEQQALGNTIQISDAEVKAAMNKAVAQAQNIPEYHLQAVLVPVPTTPTTAQVQTAQSEAASLIQQLQKGADFSTLAVSQSSGVEALQGGDMGWRQLTELPPTIAAQLASAVSGSVVGPIQTPNGFYIIKVVAIRTANATPPANLESQTRQMLFYQKFQQAVQVWLKQLRATAYVQIINS